jgi:hypothetical protein
MVASILTGRDEELPYLILDGDAMGRKLAKELGSSLYQDAPGRLLIVDKFTGLEGSEIEDLIPPATVATALDRMERNSEVVFAEIVKPGLPIVGQIEEWAEAQNVDLAQGWKVELSKRVKQQLLTKGAQAVQPEYVHRWEKLFAAIGAGIVEPG